jgi:hypothetical protein
VKPRKYSVPIREVLPTNEIGSSLGEAGAVYRGVNHRLWGNAEIVDKSRQRAEGSIRRWSTRRKNPGGMWKAVGAHQSWHRRDYSGPRRSLVSLTGIPKADFNNVWSRLGKMTSPRW